MFGPKSLCPSNRCFGCRSLFIYRFCVFPYTDCSLTNLPIPVAIKQLIVTNRPNSSYAVYITKKVCSSKLLSLNSVTSFQLSLSVELFSDHVTHVKYRVEPQWCVPYTPCCRLRRPLAARPHSCSHGLSRMTRMSLFRPVTS